MSDLGDIASMPPRVPPSRTSPGEPPNAWAMRLTSASVAVVGVVVPFVASPSVAWNGVLPSAPPTCSREDHARSRTLQTGVVATGAPAYWRFCGPAHAVVRVRNRSYYFRGGHCQWGYPPRPHQTLRGLNIGLFANTKAGSHGRGLMFWWSPAATKGGPVTVAESSLVLPGMDEFAGDGTVNINRNLRGGTFRLIGRNLPIEVTGHFRCE